MSEELNGLQQKVLDLIRSRLASSPAEVAVQLGIDLLVAETCLLDIDSPGLAVILALSWV